MSAAERILAYLNFFAEIALLCRLLHCELNRTYRSLFLYWLVQALANVAILVVPMFTYLYLYVYWGAQTINIFMAVFVVQDLYRIALREHPAVASFGRRSMLAAMAVAGVLAWSGMSLDQAIPAGQFTAIHRFATFERSMNFVILIFARDQRLAALVSDKSAEKHCGLYLGFSAFFCLAVVRTPFIESIAPRRHQTHQHRPSGTYAALPSDLDSWNPSRRRAGDRHFGQWKEPGDDAPAYRPAGRHQFRLGPLCSQLKGGKNPRGGRDPIFRLPARFASADGRPRSQIQPTRNQRYRT